MLYEYGVVAHCFAGASNEPTRHAPHRFDPRGATANWYVCLVAATHHRAARLILLLLVALRVVIRPEQGLGCQGSHSDKPALERNERVGSDVV